jgi:hypothetical protein
VAAVTLAGSACSALTLTVPGVGLWYASVELAEATALAGAVALQVLDTTWLGFVVAGGVVDGRARYRVVAGAGGWGRDLPPRAYANDAGLQVSQLLADVASAAGEAITGAPTTRLGPHFSRPLGPASFALNLLAPRAWYAQADGVVAFGARPDSPAVAYPVVTRDPAERRVELALTDSAAGVLPGTATEYGAAADVELALTDDGLRAKLYVGHGGGASRLPSALARLIDALIPGLRLRGTFEYRIVSQSGERLNLQPVRSRADLPDLARVPVRAGVAGYRSNHSPGAQVLVAFLDGDASRPAVVGFDAPDSPGWHPITLELGGPLPLGIARITDPVIAGPFGGAITGASIRIKAGS